MDKFQVIYALIIAVVALIPTVIAIVMLVKNIIKNKDWKLVLTMITEAVTTVETYAKEHPDMTDDEKTTMVIEAVEASCAAGGITVDTDLLEQITAYIKEICSWVKKDETDEEATEEVEEEKTEE